MRITLFLSLYIFFNLNLNGQPYSTRSNPADSSYIDFEQLDELTSKIIYGDKDFIDDAKIQEYINIDKSLIPNYSDEEMRKQMSLIPTTIPLTYNKEVGTVIKYFVFNKREYVTRMLTHAEYYFPIFEEKLDSRNLPVELKVLPIVESALNPMAKSRVGATGLWQIMLATSKILNLNTNTLVDERSDPDLSTDAALTYLVKLHSLYNDWLLALAAYNSGPGRVNRALRDAGNVYDFWKVKRFLPKETQNYVPSFIAMVYIIHYHKNYLLFPGKSKLNLSQVSSHRLTEQVSLKYIGENIGVDEDLLKYLNPSLKKGVVPKTEMGFDLLIPAHKESEFLNRMAAFNNDPYINKPTYADVSSTESVENAEPAEALESPMYKIVQQKAYHKVRRGENLQQIAKKYYVSVNELRKWNRMGRKEKLQSGEKLVVYKDVKIPIKRKEPIAGTKVIEDNVEVVVQERGGEETSNAASTPKKKPTYHKVKKGENLDGIARLHHCTVEDIKEWNQLTSSKLSIGTSLIIMKSSGGASSSPSKKVSLKGVTYIYHVVEPGDNIWRIARKYKNVTVDELYQLNNLSKGSTISLGDRIKVPSK